METARLDPGPKSTHEGQWGSCLWVQQIQVWAGEGYRGDQEAAGWPGQSSLWAGVITHQGTLGTLGVWLLRAPRDTTMELFSSICGTGLRRGVWGPALIYESNGLNTGSWTPLFSGRSLGLETYINPKNVKLNLTLFLSSVCMDVCTYVCVHVSIAFFSLVDLPLGEKMNSAMLSFNECDV